MGDGRRSAPPAALVAARRARRARAGRRLHAAAARPTRGARSGPTSASCESRRAGAAALAPGGRRARRSKRVLAWSETEMRLEPAGDGATRVTLELRQKLRGLARLGGFMVRRAARRALDEALEGLESTAWPVGRCATAAGATRRTPRTGCRERARVVARRGGPGGRAAAARGARGRARCPTGAADGAGDGSPRSSAPTRPRRPGSRLHAAGKSLSRPCSGMRAGDVEHAPDAVVVPRSARRGARGAAACADAASRSCRSAAGRAWSAGWRRCAASIPAVVSLDLGRLDRLVGARRALAHGVVRARLRCPAAEGALNARGLTLGHFPQSYEYATVGGCVATRSAGQASHRLRADRRAGRRPARAAPGRELDLLPIPASAAGPDLRELLVGSEGTLGRASPGRRCACGRLPASGATRASCSRSFDAGRRGVPRARAGGRGAATSPGCPTSRRRVCRSRWPAATG